MTSPRHTSPRHRAIVWFRNDLRCRDNPALAAALHETRSVAGLYVLSPAQWQQHDWSPSRIALTLAALQSLKDSLADLGIPLYIVESHDFSTTPADVQNFLEHQEAAELYLNAEYALDERRRDRTIRRHCRDADIAWHPFHGSILLYPGTVLTRKAEPFKVFTPFKRAWFAAWTERGRLPAALPQIRTPALPAGVHSAIAALQHQFPPSLFEAAEVPANEVEAHARLEEFVGGPVSGYQVQRDLPDVMGTSRLSAALAVGLLSPVQCLHRAQSVNHGELQEGDEGIRTWVSELIWRDFYLHVMYAFPDVCRGKPFRAGTDAIAWRTDSRDFDAWCNGTTGFPLVDAGMRQLNQTAWMHNRLRMVTAMFLTKYLLIDWRLGERYFMQHLVDGHFASNNGGWQWSASTGTDAAPYFRILSPVRQSERFDADGRFIRRFVPELAEVSTRAIHTPGHPELLAAGYPPPIVDMKFGRDRCLEAFRNAVAG